ncbi:hypothetical protein Q8A67_022876 [Cirrhinus molitorella]|uniref:Uncharacterized protein n=1 Tax=Cirrhinus molitorella TaxID=172907 RepID=A0AA88P8X2_9TELE|nr:hypothetical protein Q8A67_022876 [Cirrhinus molitorella]
METDRLPVASDTLILVHKDAFEPGGFCLYCPLKLRERFRNYEDFVEKLGRVRGKEAGRELWRRKRKPPRRGLCCPCAPLHEANMGPTVKANSFLIITCLCRHTGQELRPTPE